MTDQRYPLGEQSRDTVRASSGRPVDEITLDAVRAGGLSPDDLRIHPETLRLQARFAAEAGFAQLAANLRRAAELATIPHERVLAVYEALRPYRVTLERLLELADELASQYGAVETAALVREAAAAYRQRGLL
jgi:propanediol dehydratase small subunit